MFPGPQDGSTGSPNFRKAYRAATVNGHGSEALVFACSELPIPGIEGSEGEMAYGTN